MQATYGLVLANRLARLFGGALQMLTRGKS